MAKSIKQLFDDLKSVINEHESRLDDLQDEAERELLQTTIKTEKRIAGQLQNLLPEFSTQMIDGKERILNNTANIDIASRIYSVIQNELQPFSDEATEWAMEYLADAYYTGTQKTVDIWNAGSDDDLAFTFTEQDAELMEIALTKGYGKEQKGIGKIKELTSETADNIRDVMLRGIAERRTVTQLGKDLYEPDVGLTSLEITDKNGVTRTLSMEYRAKLIARNETAQIYQTAATEKAREIFGDDSWWYYGSVYEREKITEWCKKRFGRIAKVNDWNDPTWVRKEFGDSRTGTGHIHVNCRQSGHAVSPEWFDETDWVDAVGDGKPAQHVLYGEDLKEYERDIDKKIPVSKIFEELKTVISQERKEIPTPFEAASPLSDDDTTAGKRTYQSQEEFDTVFEEYKENLREALENTDVFKETERIPVIDCGISDRKAQGEAFSDIVDIIKPRRVSMTSARRDRIQKAKDVSSYIDPYVHPEVAKIVGRITADYTRRHRSYSVNDGIYMWASASNTTYLHEMGHAIEWRLDSSARKSKMWLNRRSKDTESMRDLTGLSAYGADEMAYTNDFIDPYVGKIYRDGSEVLSMGLQQFIGPWTLRKFAEDDFDHFAYVIGILQGAL